MRQTFDVVVIGAGTTGPTAAWHLARAGRRVALVERGTFEGAGARWINNLPDWMFRRAGLEPPKPPERWADEFEAVLTSPVGSRIRLGRTTMAGVDMRALVERTQRLALDAGVKAFESTRVTDVILDGERPVAITCAPANGGEGIELRARLFVDASGLGGVMRARVPLLARECPDVAPRDLCSAAHEVRRLLDPTAAATFLRRHGAGMHDMLSIVGFDGGFSTLSVTVDPRRGHVELLLGVIDDGQHSTGPMHLAAFVRANPWIGERVFGGSGRLPIRRSYSRFAAPGVALVGNAACQVFPAHGSGVGSGLIAAAMVAEAVRHEEDPGCLRAMWRYQARFQREIGGVHAAYDAFRIATQDLDAKQIDALIGSGLMTPGGGLAALDQKTPHFSPSELLQMARGAFAERKVASKLLPAVARMEALKGVYRRYPEEPNERALTAWRRAEALVG